MDFGPGISPPYSLLSIASELEDDNFNVKIIDQRVNKRWDKDLKKSLDKTPYCIGISSMIGKQVEFGIDIAKKVKEINCEVPLVWGGIHPTILPYQTLKNKYVDYVVIGEGEKTFLELAEHLRNVKSKLKSIKGVAYKNKNKIIKNEPRELIDLNELKPTPWHLVDIDDYIHKNIIVKGSKRELDIGETTRGCPHRCAYCYNTIVNKRKWRCMSVEKTIERIRSHVEKFKLDGIWLRDDNHFADINRAEKISKRLIEERLDIGWYTTGTRIDTFNKLTDNQVRLLKRSGCQGLKFGVDSGNQRILNLIKKDITIKDIYLANKRAKKLEITPYYGFMMGFPTETLKEAYDTLNMMDRLKKENKNAKIDTINLFTPYPKTELFDLSVRLGLRPPQRLEDWTRFHYLNNYAVHLKKRERKILTNISDVYEFTSELNSQAMPKYMQIMFKPIEKWLNFRKKHRAFKLMPEVEMLRRLRNKFIYDLSV